MTLPLDAAALCAANTSDSGVTLGVTVGAPAGITVVTVGGMLRAKAGVTVVTVDVVVAATVGVDIHESCLL